MEHDPTADARRELAVLINKVGGDRQAMEAMHGQVWNTTELQEDFVVIAYLAPFVLVLRKKDSVKGTVLFQNYPRLYFKFEESK